MTKQNEAEANYFASNFLAPRMAIHYSRCKNARDVAKIFYLSEEASEIDFDDYRRWHRVAVYRMSAIDWEFSRHFYNEDAGKFVYINETCPCCGRRSIIQPPAQYVAIGEPVTHIDTIHSAIPSHRIRVPCWQYRVMICLLADTGIRRGELFGIRESVINFECQEILIDRNIQWVKAVSYTHLDVYKRQ